jgi:hypothetical protein
MMPKDQLKSMLESTNRMDTTGDPPSPLLEADPKALDEFFARIDTELKLGNVPKPENRTAVIDYYRSLRLQYLSQEAAIAIKAPKKPRGSSKEAVELLFNTEE